jgi:hypothetical protein
VRDDLIERAVQAVERIAAALDNRPLPPVHLAPQDDFATAATQPDIVCLCPAKPYPHMRLPLHRPIAPVPVEPVMSQPIADRYSGGGNVSLPVIETEV